MLNFHGFLDKLFGKRVTFSVFFRIWFAFALVIMLASALAIYQMQQAIKPSAQRVVEDTLVDASQLLATLLAPSVISGEITKTDFEELLAETFSPPTTHPSTLWFHQKKHSQFHVYVTDRQGFVIYDSQGLAVGKDYSRWNDVYLTLRGQYGARTTKTNPRDEESSVMYVASPIKDKTGALIGVVSVGKPVMTLHPYIATSRDEVFKTMLYIAGLGLVISALMAGWLRHSIQQVNRYTQRLANATPPHFYLGKELNELVTAIDDMRHTIENKAYVTDYVHTLTHELKSPLTAIRASGELLGDALPPNHRIQFSQTILTQADKLQQLIERLLVLAKIEQPNFKLTLQPHNIEDILQTCLNQQQAWIQQKNLHVIVLGQASQSCSVDRFWLSQALQNAVDNAIKFANHFVLIYFQQTCDQINVVIINDCEAVPNYVLQKAFERYFSYDGRLEQSYAQKGTGLGLTLVRQVVEHHQGMVLFEQMPLENWLKHVNDPCIQSEILAKLSSHRLNTNTIILTMRLPCRH